MENSIDLDEPEALNSRQQTSSALTEAARHLDLIHLSLAGMTAIMAVLLFALSLPLLGLSPVHDAMAYAVMTLASLVGISGLYVLNLRVHKHVANQARLTEVLVNSLGQGFLVFNRDGLCENVYSQACLDMLECVPVGKKIEDVLSVPEDGKSDFRDWLLILFQPDHALGFDDVVRFLPQYFPHSEKRRINLVYRPIYLKNGTLTKVVVIATDQTDAFAARELAEKKQNFADMVCRIFKDKNQFYVTLAHVHAFLDEAVRSDVRLTDATRLLRQLHTLKALVKQFNMLDLAQTIHRVESELNEAKTNNDDFRTCLLAGRYKIADALKLETAPIMELIGSDQGWNGVVREVEERKLYGFAKQLILHKADEAVIDYYLMQIVAVPIRDCFAAFAREAMDLAGVLDKQIKPIVFTGGNPRVLSRPLQELFFSFTHICRNMLDHGIEAPVTRMARGKDAAGQITIQTDVVSSGDEQTLRLVLSDDGNGIDPGRIRAKLAEIDPDGAWQREDDQAVIQRILTWGVSTKQEVSEISGRGVGLDAVEREVRQLGGSLRVFSELYKGTRFEIRLPYRMDLSQIQSEDVKE